MNEDNGTKLPFLPDEPPADESPNGDRAAATSRRRTWILAAGVAALAVGVLLILLLVSGDESPESNGVRMAAAPAPTQTPVSPAPAPQQPASAPAPAASEGYQGYEETLGVPLERIVRQVDYALVETLLFTGYTPQAIAITEVRLASYHDEQFHYQALTIELESGPERFLKALSSALSKWAPEAQLLQSGDIWQVAVLGQVTHQLTFRLSEPAPTPTRSQGRLSVVIDDMGRSLGFARKLADLPFDVTFSVLPFEPHSREVAGLAADSGRELLLHLPMEPKAYPKVNPGPGALFTTMGNDEIRGELTRDLAQVPGVVGVNNHMGSKFTQQADAMAVVMAELKARDLFFLDSLTAPKSVGAREGLAAGLTVYKRSVFLDNIRDAAAILRQLEKAERIAAKTGQAVAIGHPYPETLEALSMWSERHDRSVRVVPVRELEPLQP